MHITVAIVLLIAAAISFALDAFRVPAAVSWTPMGFYVRDTGMDIRRGCDLSFTREFSFGQGKEHQEPPEGTSIARESAESPDLTVPSSAIVRRLVPNSPRRRTASL